MASTKAPEGWRTPGRFAKCGALILAWLLALPWFVQAHAPDTSYLRAVVSKHALELRFTFDIATLHRIERLDADGDGKVTRAEAEKVAPEIGEFFRRVITLEVNGAKTDLGTLQPLGWPVDAGDAVEEKNYGQTLLHFTFKQESPRKVIEDFYVQYEVFAQLGAVHRVVANIEQEDKHMEVVFNQFEPDYLYDTYWRQEAGADKPVFRKSFIGFLNDVWSNFGVPLIFLAAFSMLPRKLPAFVAFVLLLRLGWGYHSIAVQYSGYPVNIFSLPGAMFGVLVAMAICATIVLPLAIILRRWSNRRCFIVAAWAVLIFGGICIAAAPMHCMGVRKPNTSKSG